MSKQHEYMFDWRTGAGTGPVGFTARVLADGHEQALAMVNEKVAAMRNGDDPVVFYDRFYTTKAYEPDDSAGVVNYYLWLYATITVDEICYVDEVDPSQVDPGCCASCNALYNLHKERANTMNEGTVDSLFPTLTDGELVDCAWRRLKTCAALSSEKQVLEDWLMSGPDCFTPMRTQGARSRAIAVSTWTVSALRAVSADVRARNAVTAAREAAQTI